MERTRVGAYRILGDLGTGGMGRVYEAEVVDVAPGLEPGARVALKVVHPHLLEAPGFLERFSREAQIGRRVRHENVVRTYDCDEALHEGVPWNFLVMELVRGQTLRELLRELDRVPEELCCHVGREIAKGLGSIHAAGAVHRDLKPANVLITPQQMVKIMDLGVALLRDETTRLSQTGAFVGSLAYAAPEQLGSGGSDVDPRSDLHALGVLLYELSTGQHPFEDADAAVIVRRILQDEPRPVGELNPQLSPFFEQVVATLLSKQKEDRFASAAALHEALAEGEDGDWWRDRAVRLHARTDRPLRRVRIPRETALYGRQQELETLSALYARAQAGDGQVLLLEGEAGIGKTRLVDEFVGRLRREGEDPEFLFGSYPPGGAATAAGAFATAFRERFGAEGLEEALARPLASMPLLVPAFAALLRGAPAPQGEQALTAESVSTAFVHVTRALADRCPTIVLIDDMHFAPEEGRALFAALAHAVPGHRILLVGTMRPGVSADWVADVARDANVAQMALPRLGAGDLVRLLEDAFDSEHLAHELAGKIALKCDGNPFFTFEIIRGLREGKFITQKADGTWVTTQVIDDIHVPASVVELVGARIADLSEEEADLLDVASCCGYEFDPLLLAAVLETGEIAVLRRLGRMEKKGRLVRASGRAFVFDHHQVQEAVYAGLSELLRERYHHRIADVLEARTGARDTDADALDGGLAARLSSHFLEGTDPQRASPYLERALEHFSRTFSHQQGVELARRALEVPGLLEGARRATVLLDQAGHLGFLGRRDAEASALGEALALATEHAKRGLQARLHRALGGHHLTLGRFDEARRELERALELAAEAGDATTEMQAHATIGQTFLHQGQHRKARPYFEHSLQTAQAAGHREGESGALVNLGHVSYRAGDYEQARRSYEKALDVASAAGDRLGTARANAGLGNVLYRLERFEEAREVLVHSLTLAREMGERRGESLVTGNLGHVLRKLGRHDEARAYCERDLALAQEMGDREGVARAMGNLGNVLWRLGHLQEAQAHYERQHAMARELGDLRGVSSAANSLGYMYEQLGRYEEARAHLQESLAVSKEIGHRHGEGTARGNLAHVLWQLGLYAEARHHFERWREVAAAMANRRVEATALSRLGLIAISLGRIDEAEAHYGGALEIAQKLGDADLEREARVGLAAVAGARGDPADARRRLEEARSAGGGSGVPESAWKVLADLGFLERPASTPEPAVTDPEATTAARLDKTVTGAPDEPDPRMGPVPELKARFDRWMVSRDGEDLRQARRLLDRLVEHAPEESRESMLRNVRLHREIVEAWEERGEDAEEDAS